VIVRSRRLSASIGSFCDNGFTDLRHIQLVQEVKDNPDILNPLDPLDVIAQGISQLDGLLIAEGRL
jgi:hypothetical protein